MLQQLEANVNRLLSAHVALQKENDALKQTVKHQREELLRTYGELSVLQKEYKTLLTAHALSGNTGDKVKARERLTRLIDMVDKALEQLAE